MLQTLEREPQESYHHHGMPHHHPMTHGGPHGNQLINFLGRKKYIMPSKGFDCRL